LDKTLGSCFKIQDIYGSFSFTTFSSHIKGSLFVVAVCCTGYTPAAEDVVINYGLLELTNYLLIRYV
jgi:hypothetical protein